MSTFQFDCMELVTINYSLSVLLYVDETSYVPKGNSHSSIYEFLLAKLLVLYSLFFQYSLNALTLTVLA